MSLLVHGWVQGDCTLLVVLVREDQTVRELTEQLCQAASVRVTGTDPYTIFCGKRLDPNSGVRAAGIGALDRVDVLFR